MWNFYYIAKGCCFHTDKIDILHVQIMKTGQKSNFKYWLAQLFCIKDYEFENSVLKHCAINVPENSLFLLKSYTDHLLEHFILYFAIHFFIVIQSVNIHE